MTSTAHNISVPSGQPRLRVGTAEKLVSLAVFALVVLALGYGWAHRSDDFVNPEHGLGYILGIIGGTLMIILLGYPLRKRLGSRRALGSVGFWFRFHMALGLAGPLAILYHARFGWGALNSAVALGAMLVVAGSGLVGRYFYSRVHRGFTDRKLELRSLKSEMAAQLDELTELDGEIVAQLRRLEERALAAGTGFWSSAAAIPTIGLTTRRTRREVFRQIGADRVARRVVDDWFEAVRRTAEFAFFDRLLRLWHLLHLPLFLIMVAAAVLHIVAVHMY